MERDKIYFLSDAHLGSAWHKRKFKSENTLILPDANKSSYSKDNSREHDIERKLCRWLDFVKKDAKAIYLLGDIFDYWFEYKYVVPRGYTRFLGKISELTDSGVEIHFFIGNHDIWIDDYFREECGMILHTEPLVMDFNGLKFFLAHGDGLGDNSVSFKILRSIFHNKVCRKLYAAIHPRWTMALAHKWSTHSRLTGDTPPYLGEEKEHLVLFAKEHLKIAPNINYFIFGHRHIMLDLMLSISSRVIILGDWLQYFSYGVFDGENFTLKVFEETHEQGF